MSHTKTPWWNSNLEIGNDPVMNIKIAKVSGANYDEALANAERIVLCVNALNGISNEVLNSFVSNPQAVKALEEVLKKHKFKAIKS